MSLIQLSLVQLCLIPLSLIPLSLIPLTRSALHLIALNGEVTWSQATPDKSALLPDQVSAAEFRATQLRNEATEAAARHATESVEAAAKVEADKAASTAAVEDQEAVEVSSELASLQAVMLAMELELQVCACMHLSLCTPLSLPALLALTTGYFVTLPTFTLTTLTPLIGCATDHASEEHQARRCPQGKRAEGGAAATAS